MEETHLDKHGATVFTTAYGECVDPEPLNQSYIAFLQSLGSGTWNAMTPEKAYDELDDKWMNIGLEQRKVPMHILQETFHPEGYKSAIQEHRRFVFSESDALGMRFFATRHRQVAKSHKDLSETVMTLEATLAASIAK